MEILNHKKKIIEEVKKINKDEMFPKKKEQISFFKKLKIILNGRK